MADTLTITDNRTGKQYEIPIQDGTIRAMDLRQIKAQPDDFGMMTYDPAFTNTAACRSRITFIDGDKGVLMYRGYPIEQLAEHSTYLETAYLVLFGELPDKAQLDKWIKEVGNHMVVPEGIKKTIEGFRHDAHPMGMFLSTVGALGTFYPDAKDISDPATRRLHSIRLIAKAPTIAAYALRHTTSSASRASRQRAQLHRQLPEHAVQDDRAAVQAEPGAGTGARSAVHPARRPRAELQHARDARHRQLTGGSVLGARRRGGRPLRTAPRRRQRGRAADAEGDRLAAARARTSSSASRAAKAA